MGLTFNMSKIDHPRDIQRAPIVFKKEYSHLKFIDAKDQFMRTNASEMSQLKDKLRNIKQDLYYDEQRGPRRMRLQP